MNDDRPAHAHELQEFLEAHEEIGAIYQETIGSLRQRAVSSSKTAKIDDPRITISSRTASSSSTPMVLLSADICHLTFARLGRKNSPAISLRHSKGYSL